MYQQNTMTNMQQPVYWRCSLDLLAEKPPEIEWLIPGIIPAGSVQLLSGREGCMKTWLTLDWAHCAAEGATWLGRPCGSVAVLYLDAEMPANLFHERLHAMGGSKNLNIWRWQDPTFPSKLDDPLLLKASKEHRLIVVDTLKRFMDGLKENSSDDMAIITGQLRELTATVIALHHGKKDRENPGYRGSTELGAGVDIALHVEKKANSRVESLEITAAKTRYAEDSQLTFRVERTASPSRPVFHEISSKAQAGTEVAQATQLTQLADLIGELHSASGSHPNQTKIVKTAKEKELGSRNTILGWLIQGEGSRWHSELDGRSRVYGPIVQLSTCPTPRGLVDLDNKSQPNAEPVQLSNTQGTGQMDNSATGQNEPVHLSNSQGNEQLDNRMAKPNGSVHLSNCSDTRGEDRLDNAQDTCAPRDGVGKGERAEHD